MITLVCYRQNALTCAQMAAIAFPDKVTPDDSRRAMTAIDSMVRLNRVSLDDFRQLTESIPFSHSVIARELGVSNSHLIRLIVTNAISVDNFCNAFAMGTLLLCLEEFSK